MSHLHSLLGHGPSSSLIHSLLQLAADKADLVTIPPPEVTTYKDAVFHSFRPLGISLDYDPSTNILAAIHLYNSPADGFATFPLEFVLVIASKSLVQDEEQEHGQQGILLSIAMLAKDIVALLGEPEKKTGGGRAGQCWIGYPTKLGMSADLAGANWEDGCMSLSCITLTAPTAA